MELRKHDLSAEQQHPPPYGQPGYPGGAPLYPPPQQGFASDSQPHSSYVPTTSQPYPGEAINPGYQPDHQLDYQTGYQPEDQHEYQPGYHLVSSSAVDSAVRRGDMVATNRASAKSVSVISICIGIFIFIIVIIFFHTHLF